MINKNLFIEFLRVYAFQPATGFWRAIEADIFRKYLPNKGICLDVGCGDGKLTSILYNGNIPPELSLIGVDSDPDETSQASTFQFYKRIHTCYASNIPEESNIFDNAFSNSVLEHIEDIEATLSEVSRLLKIDGTFTFTVPGPGFHECLYGPLNRNGSREDYLKEIDKRLAHYRYWSFEEWESNLSKCGMRVVDHVEYFSCREVQRWENISRFTAGILYALSRHKHRPIVVQKKLGLRKIQNRYKLPIWFAKILAHFFSIGVKPRYDKQNACILIVARKTADF